MTFLPLEEFNELATKPIFTCTEWKLVPESYDTSLRPVVTADLLCRGCQKEKTFSGKAYSRMDLGMKYQQEAHSSHMYPGMPFFDDNSETETMDKMIDECVLPVGNTVTVQLKCPACNSLVYVCYAVEFNRKQGGIRNVFDEANREPDKYRVQKIGEYPSQETSRLQTLSKYKKDFPNEYDFLINAERAFYADLGAGAIIYLRKAYETLIYNLIDDMGINRPLQFRQALEIADNAASFIPVKLKDRAYGLFGEMSDAVHGEADDLFGFNQYELLRDVFKMILDNLLEERKQDALAARIKTDEQAKRGAKK
jgi:hypothetical protein